jgi:5'-3' exonuclease
MATYILVDSLNTFMRAKHAGGAKDIDMRVGMAMHIMFNSVRKAWRDFKADHVVFCLEGRSWRKDFYPQYKANRKVLAAKRTPREVEDDQLFFEAYDALIEFINDKTNCTVISCATAEADDLIATWIQTHPDDSHVIVSTDSDFHQLLAHNVSQYNGITEEIVKIDGVFNTKTGKQVIDKKTGVPKSVGDPNFVLFEKCVRGDPTDNIFSAYPGARLKGSKNKTGITEAYADMNRGGFNYNNFMLQRWVDHNNIERRVRDDFERNRVLIDLTAQPEDVRKACMSAIHDAINKQYVRQVGIHFMKFCARWNLQRLSDNASDFAEILNKGVTKTQIAATQY